jgi:hypothetical protein
VAQQVPAAPVRRNGSPPVPEATFSLFLAERTLRKAPLDKTARHVARALAGRANSQGTCWPSVPLIASDTGLGERAVQNAIGRLVKKGFITKSAQKERDGRQTSNLYTLKFGFKSPPSRPPSHSPTHPTEAAEIQADLHERGVHSVSEAVARRAQRA